MLTQCGSMIEGFSPRAHIVKPACSLLARHWQHPSCTGDAVFPFETLSVDRFWEPRHSTYQGRIAGGTTRTATITAGHMARLTKQHLDVEHADEPWTEDLRIHAALTVIVTALMD